MDGTFSGGFLSGVALGIWMGSIIWGLSYLLRKRREEN